MTNAETTAANALTAAGYTVSHTYTGNSGKAFAFSVEGAGAATYGDSAGTAEVLTDGTVYVNGRPA
jgi:hypothetical protein